MKRLSSGGRIDRSRPFKVRFGWRFLQAFEGDTLASALMAGGVSVVGRSFKYHRPRGVFSAGVEEPNALAQVGKRAQREPNARATTIEAFKGLKASAQNAWPNRRLDIGAAAGLLSPFISAGFYYKTFIGPFRQSTRFWMICEAFIRRAAGMGKAGYAEDHSNYEKRHAFCDVLVIGGGMAGLCAALAAGRAGAQVILAEQDFKLGGAILAQPLDDESTDWLNQILSELEVMQNVRILTRTTVFGAYDGNTFGSVERATEHRIDAPASSIRQRYWVIRAKQAILATGAIERPLVFGGNDRPGVMLAGAARAYLNRFAVLAGRKVVVCTNNDSAYSAAVDLAHAGAAVTVADLRRNVSEETAFPAEVAGVNILRGHGVLKARGFQKVASALVAPVDYQGRATGPARSMAADLIAVSGGWAPAIHLWSHRFGKPAFDPGCQAFVPTDEPSRVLRAAGCASAAASVQETIEQGFARGAEAARASGSTRDSGQPPASVAMGSYWQHGLSPVWSVRKSDGSFKGKAFVDFQHDVTIADIDQAHAEGYVSVEHLKRYTTTGMATDQGKLANTNALSRMAELRFMEITQVGATTFRPPFTPVAAGAITGHRHGRHFRPTRLSPIHHWHMRNGAKMIEAGAWMRPWFYPDQREDMRAAYIREAAHVRGHAGMVDVSTLGKIAVQGPDSAEFLNRIYVNGWKTLQVGSLRYGVMLREDGFAMDDGATARLAEHDYFMSTTTANAAKVLAFAERLLQTAWKNLKVHVTSVTDQWAAIALAGPNSRALLSKVSDSDFSREALPNNRIAHASINGVDVRIHRMSYSGELAYEIYVPAGFGIHVWETLYAAGDEFGLIPYGTEAMGALRIEKGHVAGPEIDGRTTLNDLCLDGFASTKKPFVGSVLRNRPVLTDPKRPSLVGLEIQGDAGAKPGSLLFPEMSDHKGHGDGWISSATYSPALGRNIALAFLKNGKHRKGEFIKIVNFVDNETQQARVVSHHFFDPQGDRQNG